jgi:uroporphyrinogen decarboxylase
MNMMNFLRGCLNQPHNKSLPVLSFPGVQLIGATVRDLVSHGELQASCMKAIADRYPMLASVSNMDLSVEAEAFGARTVYSDNEVPSITGQLIRSAEDAASLQTPAVGAGRTGECIKAIALAKRMITDRPVLAGVIGPFSLAGRLMEMTQIMYRAVDEPESVHEVLAKVTDFLTCYILALKQAGADGVVMAEPAAGLLSPAWNDAFSVEYIQRIIAAVQDDHFLVIYHNCGHVVPLIPGILRTGIRAFHFGNAIQLADVIDQIPADRLVLGNIDSTAQLARGTPDSIAAATRSLMAGMRGHQNFILSSGCDIPPQTPLANIDAFFAAAAGYAAESILLLRLAEVDRQRAGVVR